MLYDLTALDRRPLPGVHVVGDDAHLPFTNGVFDWLIFDPPYAGGMGGHNQGGARFKKGQGDKLQYWATGNYEAKYEHQVTSMPYPKLRTLIGKVLPEFWRVTKPSGGVIMKSGEFREKDELFPITAYAWSKWSILMKLEALLIQVIPPPDLGPKGAARRKYPVLGSHNTWSVWKHRN